MEFAGHVATCCSALLVSAKAVDAIGTAFNLNHHELLFSLAEVFPCL
jgi:hypothetical protein